MPRPKLPPRLYLEKAQHHPETGKVIRPANWRIKDGDRSIRTGFREEEEEQAKERLAAYLACHIKGARSPEDVALVVRRIHRELREAQAVLDSMLQQLVSYEGKQDSAGGEG